MVRDLVRSICLSVVCFAIVLAAVFRTIRGVVVPLTCLVASVVVFFGVSTLLGTLSVIEIAAPGLVNREQLRP